MSAKAKYVKLVILEAGSGLSGYRVLGDYTEGSRRVLLLERPEAPKKTNPKPPKESEAK